MIQLTNKIEKRIAEMENRVINIESEVKNIKET